MQAVILRIVYKLFEHLPWGVVAGIGSGLGAVCAVLPLRVNRLARENIRRGLKISCPHTVRRIHFSAACNLGKTLCLLPKVYTLPVQELDKHVVIEGHTLLEQHADALFLTAHIGNWEVLCRKMGDLAPRAAHVYRRSNNAGVDALIRRYREKSGSMQIPKGQEGARMLINTMQKTAWVGMLVDQKMNDGIEATLLNLPAKTAPALAELARKYNKTILPVCVMYKKSRVHIMVEPPLVQHKSDNRTADVAATMQAANDLLSGWIKEYPEQWLWWHDRFGIKKEVK